MKSVQVNVASQRAAAKAAYALTTPIRALATRTQAFGGTGGYNDNSDIPPSKRNYEFDKIPYVKKYKDGAYAETAVNALEQLVKKDASLNVDNLIDIMKMKFKGELYNMEFMEGIDKTGGGYMQIYVERPISYDEARMKYQHIISYLSSKNITHIVIPIIKMVEIDLMNLSAKRVIVIPINWSDDVVQSEWDL